MNEGAALSILAALAVDYLLGEPPNRFHPWYWVGHLASEFERLFNRSLKKGWVIFLGALASCLLFLIVFVFVGGFLSVLPPVAQAIVVLYFCVGYKSLVSHVTCVKKNLEHNDIQAARKSVSLIVSRNTKQMDQGACIRATVESLVENFSDAVTASLFWYCIGGWPLVLLHRLVNLLDAMWGYKTPQFLYFGRFVAYLDDMLNYMPARLTVLSYLLVGSGTKGMSEIRLHARKWASPNAGVLIAAAAGSFKIRLGGLAYYSNGMEHRPYIGTNRHNSIKDIDAALVKIWQAFLVWLVVIMLLLAVV